jgi:hypothetical protein
MSWLPTHRNPEKEEALRAFPFPPQLLSFHCREREDSDRVCCHLASRVFLEEINGDGASSLFFCGLVLAH